MAYKAKDRMDLLSGIDEFLDQVTVLPPGEWDPTIRIEPPKNVPSQVNDFSMCIFQKCVFVCFTDVYKLKCHRQQTYRGTDAEIINLHGNTVHVYSTLQMYLSLISLTATDKLLPVFLYITLNVSPL